MCFHLLSCVVLFFASLVGTERVSAPDLMQIPPFAAARIQPFDERSVPKLVIPVHDPLARPKLPDPEVSIAKLMGIGIGFWGIGHATPYILRLITHGLTSAADLFLADIQSSPGSVLKVAGAATILAGTAWYIPRKYNRDVKYAADYTDALVRETRAIQSNEREMVTHINNLYKTSMLSLHRASYSVGSLSDFYEHYVPTMRIIGTYRDSIDRATRMMNENRYHHGEDHKKAMQSMSEIRVSMDLLARRIDAQEEIARAKARHSSAHSDSSSSSSSSSSSVSSSIVSSAVTAARSIFEPKSPRPRPRSASVSLQVPLSLPQQAPDSTSDPEKPEGQPPA